MELSASEQRAQQMEAQLQAQIVRFFKYAGIVLVIWLVGYLGFSVSWLLMAVLAYVITSFMKQQKQARSAVALQLATDERQFLMNVENLPSWVFFPDVERAEWLNLMILQAWPFVRSYVVDMINNSIIPNVKANLPSTLSSFSFVRLDLGDCAPRIGGVKVYTGKNIRRSEIVMDVDLMYFGDCNIEVKWKAFKAGISSLEFRAKARVVVAPLIAKMPIAGAVSVTLLSNPYINFDLTNLGNVLDMPGLRQLLIRAITDQVASLTVLPKVIAVPLTSGLDLNQLKFPLPQGVVLIRIIEAKDLKKADIGFLKKGKSDPYVIAKVGQHTFTTKVIANTVEPQWNEQFEALVHVRTGQALEIDVLDEDPGSKDDPLGSTLIDLEAVAQAGAIDTWTKLDDVDTGSIHVSLSWANLLDDATSFQSQDQAGQMSLAFLFVEVDSCRGLPCLERGREPSAVVSLSVGGSAEQETRVVEVTPDPVFEEGFNFLVGSPAVEVLKISIFDQQTRRTRIAQLSVCLRLLLTERRMRTHRSFVLDTGSAHQAQITLGLTLRAVVPGRASDIDLSKSDSPIALKPQPPKEAPKSEQPLVVAADAAAASTEQPSLHVEEHSSDKAASFTVDSTSTSATSEVRNRKPTATSGYGRIQLTLRYSNSRQCLVIVVHQAKDLVGQDDDGLSDPYVKFYVTTAGRSSKKQKTKQVKNNLNPVFDESFEVALSEHELAQSNLCLQIVNHVSKFSRKSMGRVEVPLGSFQHNATVWYDICADGDADSSK